MPLLVVVGLRHYVSKCFSSSVQPAAAANANAMHRTNVIHLHLYVCTHLSSTWFNVILTNTFFLMQLRGRVDDHQPTLTHIDAGCDVRVHLVCRATSRRSRPSRCCYCYFLASTTLPHLQTSGLIWVLFRCFFSESVWDFGLATKRFQYFTAS